MLAAVKAKIFYSWQSDIKPAAACRTMIGDALEAAARDLGTAGEIDVEAVVDRDTLDIAGAPDIGATILAKIDAASAFVADVTIVGRIDGKRPTPNPNVLFELGYALKALSERRLVLVQNTVFGEVHDLPFDLRQKRVLRYQSAADAPDRVAQRRQLASDLRVALGTILRQTPMQSKPAEVTLTLSYENETIRASEHFYRLVVTITNVSQRRINDWEIEIEFPTQLLHGGHSSRVARRSNETTTIFLIEGKNVEPLRPGSALSERYAYTINDTLYARRESVYRQLVRARALVDGEIACTVERPISELQNF